MGLALVVITFFTHCSNDKVTDAVKLLPNDPFKNTIVPSQFFSVDSEQDNVIAGEYGTVIVLPQGCFKDAAGNIVDGTVKIELAESLTMDDMVLSNLTTTSNGNPLETDGMIYFNAVQDGEQLVINKDIPIHIEIPTRRKKPGMMAYKGIRDENGNMNWVDPEKLDNFLKTVDINSLDFLPPGFQSEVDKGMPFRNHKTAAQSLTDSLYYALSTVDIDSLNQGLSPDLYNEPYYNNSKEVKKGRYTSDSYKHSGREQEGGFDSVVKCGIDPAIVKVIKSDKYQNTFIATKEFEARLKAIFPICDNSVLEFYIKNTNKNLYEIDSMVALFCNEKKMYDRYHVFYDFSQQRLTNVRDADRYTNLLNDYYSKQLAKVKAELEGTKAKVLKALHQENSETQKIVDDYKKLLWKREKYRMETYGFNWTETGWVNIDNGTLPKDWGMQPLEVTVTNGKQFDRVYTYVIYTSIKSLNRLNTNDNENFYAGNVADKSMLMPDKKLAIAIAIGYQGDVPSIAMKSFETTVEQQLTLTLNPSTLEKLKAVLARYEEQVSENSVSQDLAFMEKLYKKEQQQKAATKEREFIIRLWKVAFPCCAQSGEGNESNDDM